MLLPSLSLCFFSLFICFSCFVSLFFPNSVSLEGSNGGKEGRIRPQRGGRPMPDRTAPDNPARPFLQSVSRIWASRRSPRPAFAECLKDLLHRRCARELRRPVFDECFKDLGLPEISAARFCRVFQGFAAPALPRRSPEARF